MDVGDGFYQLGLAFFTILSAYVHLLGVIAISFGFLLRGKVQRTLAIATLALLAIDHLIVAWQGMGIWKEVFLGIADELWYRGTGIPIPDRTRFWAVFFAVSSSYIALISAVWIFGRSSLDASQSQGSQGESYRARTHEPRGPV